MGSAVTSRGIRHNNAIASYDDEGTTEGAQRVAGSIVASQASLVLGPAFSFLTLAAGPVYAAAGLAVLPTTATADSITRNPTTFRVIFKNSAQGELLATYLSRVLGLRYAAVIAVDDGYGRTLQAGFESAANRLGIAADYFFFKTPADADQAVQSAAADPSRPAVALMMLDADAARILTMLRRLGVKAPVLGGDALGDEIISERLAAEPEEQRQRGSLTDGLYAISPMILDSANAETLAFAARFRARFGHDPLWQSVTGCDAARLAIAAARAAAAQAATAEPASMRAAVLGFLRSLTSPLQAVPGLLGPIWFDQDRGREQAIRIGRFNAGRFESAPLQIVPVTLPAAAELASGAVFEMQPRRFARLQRVVYTGAFLNDVPHIDISRSSFGADFYVWLRFARNAEPDSPDPSDIAFPNMLSGRFAPRGAAESVAMADGTGYRLWRVQGEFRTDFDLHAFPFDRQDLQLRFFNARASSERIIYALDRRTPPPTGGRVPPRRRPPG